MTEDDAGAFAARGIGDDRAYRQGRPRMIAVVTGQVDAVHPVIDMGHEQALSRRIGLSEAAGEEVDRCGSRACRALLLPAQTQDWNSRLRRRANVRLPSN